MFPNFSSTQKHLKQIFISRDTTLQRLQTRRQEAFGNPQILFPYCQLADKFPAIFQVLFGILHGLLRFVQRFVTFVWLCNITNFFIIKSNKCTKFTNLFWCETLHVSDNSSVDHQEFIHRTLRNVYVIQVCRQLSSRTRMEFHPNPARKKNYFIAIFP